MVLLFAINSVYVISKVQIIKHISSMLIVVTFPMASHYTKDLLTMMKSAEGDGP